MESNLTNSIPDSSPNLGGTTILDVEGDDWAFGFNLGTMLQINEKTRFGLAYYSKVDFDLEGQVKTDTGFPGVLPSRSTTSASAASSLPQSIELSGYHEPENWKDVYRIAAGVTYKHHEKWTFRTGIAFDESPVSSAKFRTLRIPDSDRIWLSAGTTYKINERYSVDFGYTHVFAKTVDLAESATAGSFNGSSGGNVNIVGLSFNGSF